MTEETKMRNDTCKVWFLLPLAGLLLSASAGSAAASDLWYNGDFDDSNALANVIGGVFPDARVFDDFNVTDKKGWHITSVWSNDLMNYTDATQASWSIRSGVSVGDGGTIIASGTDTMTQTSTGRSRFGTNEYSLPVSGLDIDLTSGTYWLQVTPLGAGFDFSRCTTTMGANAIGTPAGNDGNSYFTASQSGIDFRAASDYLGRRFSDFSMGVDGSVIAAPAVPEPGSPALLAGIGVFGSLCVLRRRRKNSAVV